ncbi:MAG: MBL fold metallo-hydrolase [Eubacteriales bacterium]
MKLYDCGDDAFLMNIENAGQGDFDTLCRYVTGHVRDAEISENDIAGNRFLSVRGNSGYEYLYYVPAAECVRMIVCEKGELIPEKLTQEDCFEGDKKIIQLCPDDEKANFGMGYIICIGNGHFIIYDGNGDLGGMSEKIMHYLNSNTPKGVKPIIDAWFVTHFHWDHVAGMLDFSKKYSSDVCVRNIIANFPALENVYSRERGPNTEFYVSWWPKITRNFSEAKIWKVHTGQKIRVADVVIEILFTHEDVYPVTLYSNDTTTVSKMYIDGKSIFFAGDVSGSEPCRLIHDMYGTYLKSDIYQVSHHGWDSEALKFYFDVDADIVLWPLRKRDWDIIRQFPATACMVREMNEGKRSFLISRDDDIVIDFKDLN